MQINQRLLYYEIFSWSQIIKRVIYLTLDGVRWQDLFLTQDYFPILWNKYADKLSFYGAPNSGTAVQVASIPTSLPSYQSQMAGAVQPCTGNDGGRIQVETFPERLVRELSWNKKDVATFSSWDKINLAVERIEGTTHANTGNTPAYDPDTQQADVIMDEINHHQTEDHPGFGVRYDKYTFAHALHYLKTYQPRFLWIALNDSDDIAHANLLEEYHQSLRFYDQAIDTVFTTLETLGLADETVVIVTTDHGRGHGEGWVGHGVEYPGSEQTWAFVMNGELIADYEDNGIRYYSTLSIRPTVESVFRM